MTAHDTFDLILIGAHCAGKSTLGARLADALGIPFEDALERRLRDEALAQHPGLDADPPDLDERLWSRELSRDLRAAALPRRPGPRRIVETWHIGNATYAACRAPHEATRWRSRLHSILLGHDVPVVVQPLAVPPETFAARASAPGLSDEAARRSSRRVGWALRRAALDAPVHTLPTLWTHVMAPDQCVALIMQRLHALTSL